MENRLKELRENAGMTQTELAFKAGVTERYIAFLESGDRKPSLTLAGKLAKLLNKPVDYIFLP